MDIQCDQSGSGQISLTQYEGLQIVQLLDYWLGRECEDSERQAISLLVEQFGDANWLSRWLREDVKIELTPEGMRRLQFVLSDRTVDAAEQLDAEIMELANHILRELALVIGKTDKSGNTYSDISAERDRSNTLANWPL